MIRTSIFKDNRSAEDCREKWPNPTRRPYYNLEKRFTANEGSF